MKQNLLPSQPLAARWRHFAPAALAAVPVAAFVVAALWVFNKHFWAEQRLAELAPRHARLLGLQQSQQAIEQALQNARQTLATHAYPASQDATQAGNDVQQKIRDVLSRAGLEVVSSQVLPAKEEGPFDRVMLSLRMEGELIPLQSGLLGLVDVSPLISVESFAIQVIGAAKPEVPQKLSVQMTLFTMRLRP